MVLEVLSLLRPNERRRDKTAFAGLSSLLSTGGTPAQRTEPIGTGLRKLIDALAQAGRELQSVADGRLAAPIAEVLDGMGALSCRVAVVGQVKAGKSSFINALTQRGDLLPTHVNPWTAVATRLHFGMPGQPITGSDFTFFTAQEWDALGLKANGSGREFEEGFAEMKSRAEARLGDQFHHLLGKAHFYQSVQPGILQHYLCAGPPVGEVSREIRPGRYADITKTANVYFPLPPLAMPTVLIDTPGTNDATHLRHRITREIIEGADIYIVVLTARQALASSDIGLLKLLRGLEKKRIIVFVNRIDELAGGAGDIDLVVQRVRDDLARVFEDITIPVVAGSAKWAGLSALDDIEMLRSAAKTASFRALAERKSFSMPTPDENGSDLAGLQQCFRQASGLNAVSRLLSLFMLSGFVSNHAKGVADVLLSAADISASSAHRQLQSAAGTLRDRQGNASRTELTALANMVGALIQSFKNENEQAVREGLARLHSALEADIRAADGSHDEASRTMGTAKASEAWTFDAQIARGAPEEEPGIAERSSWLASVKQATFGLLRKARMEPAAPPEPEKKPTTGRSTSLTVPVTSPSRDVSMDGGGAWWSEWMNTRNGAAQNAPPLRNGAHGRSLLDLPGDAALGTELTSLAPLTQLASRFHAVLEQDNPPGVAGEGRKATDEACLTIVVCERVMRQVGAVFAPQGSGD
jgi:hypothetical protein